MAGAPPAGGGGLLVDALQPHCSIASIAVVVAARIADERINGASWHIVMCTSTAGSEDQVGSPFDKNSSIDDGTPTWHQNGMMRWERAPGRVHLPWVEAIYTWMHCSKSGTPTGSADRASIAAFVTVRIADERIHDACITQGIPARPRGTSSQNRFKDGFGKCDSYYVCCHMYGARSKQLLATTVCAAGWGMFSTLRAFAPPRGTFLRLVLELRSHPCVALFL